MKYLSIVVLIVIAILSCKAPQKNINFDHGSYKVESSYGEGFNVGEVTSINTLYGKIGQTDTLDVVVEANIESVCKKKGCWMNLVDATTPDEEKAFFVKFKDYGFFVPVDSEGYKVLVKGKAYKEITSVDELRHYAEDEGKSEEEIAMITEPEEELKIMSTGVYKVE